MKYNVSHRFPNRSALESSASFLFTAVLPKYCKTAGFAYGSRRTLKLATCSALLSPALPGNKATRFRRGRLLTLGHARLISWNLRNALQLAFIMLFFLTGLPACSSASSRKEYSRPTQKPYVINNRVYYPIPSSYGFTQTGIASWYGEYFHGRKTSNAEIYNMYELTAAHKTLPMNTILLVRNLENNREIVIRVNDRGPFVRGRVIDLSYTAAKKLDIIGKGTARVHITALGDAKKGNADLKRMAKNFYIGEFYIQIGSFANMNNALRLQKRFTKAGHTTLIQKYYGPDRVYHRVHVYVGKNLKGAEQERKILESRGYRDAFVIAH